MAIQFLPILKAVAPYLAQVATAAIPAFTARPSSTAAAPDPVIAKQIEELQQAVTQNAQSIHLLAEKTQQLIQGMELAAEAARQQQARYRSLLILALGVASLSLLLSLALLFR
ncbi:MAG: hypothetical protein K0A95_04940 [Chromatiales bacterium]|nr:hypothetical protein [Chromatiales bacterium]